MSIDDKYGRNRSKFRRVYAYGTNRRPDIREFFDSVTEVSKSFNFQQIIRDRNYYLVAGDMVLTFPTASIITQYSEQNYHTTGSVESISVNFPFTFDQIPFVGLGLYPEWNTTSGSNVGYWVTNLGTTGFTANFSAPFEGKLTYRAVYTDGSYPVYVQRTSGSYVWVAAAEQTFAGLSSVTMSFDALPSIPTEVFSNPVGSTADPTLNIGQSYAAVDVDFTTNNLSEPYTGLFDVVAIATVPSGSPQPVDPP